MDYQRLDQVPGILHGNHFFFIIQHCNASQTTILLQQSTCNQAALSNACATASHGHSSLFIDILGNDWVNYTIVGELNNMY